MPRNFTLQDAAKMLGTGRQRLVNELKRRQVLDSRAMAHQRHIDAGRFVVQMKEHHKNPDWNHGHGQIYYQTKVTQKGLRWLANELGVEIINADQDNAA